MAGEGATFAASGYGVVPGLIAPGLANMCAAYALANRNLPEYYVPERPFNAWGRYADSMGEVLLARVQARVEAVTDMALYPAYSYLRLYCEGATLPRHTDRPSCEISVTLALGGEASKPWPIWVEAGGRSHNVVLGPGDAMVYRGAILPHWRERLAGSFWVQLFLHYVDRTGEFADCRFDGRGCLGPVEPGRDARSANLRRRFDIGDPCPCGSGLTYGDCHGRNSAV